MAWFSQIGKRDIVIAAITLSLGFPLGVLVNRISERKAEISYSISVVPVVSDPSALQSEGRPFRVVDNSGSELQGAVYGASIRFENTGNATISSQNERETLKITVPEGARILSSREVSGGIFNLYLDTPQQLSLRFNNFDDGRDAVVSIIYVSSRDVVPKLSGRYYNVAINDESKGPVKEKRYWPVYASVAFLLSLLVVVAVRSSKGDDRAEALLGARYREIIPLSYSELALNVPEKALKRHPFPESAFASDQETAERQYELEKWRLQILRYERRRIYAQEEPSKYYLIALVFAFWLTICVLIFSSWIGF